MLSLYFNRNIMDTDVMIEKVVAKRGLHDRSGVGEDLQYWLSRTLEGKAES